MTLIVETGSGQDTTANSYINEADANLYLTNSARNSGPWKDAGKTKREGLLVLAAQYMTARWNTNWAGWQAHEDQPLDWPRLDVVKKSGHFYDSSEIPEAVRRAQIEYAVAEANNPGSLFPAIQYDDTNRDLVAIREKVDVIEESREFADNSITKTWRKFPAADGLLKHITVTTGHLLRV